MKLYRFSPIQSQAELMQAIKHIHLSCYQLCKHSLGHYLPNAGNIGIFCHYDDEYEFLTNLRKELTKQSDNPDQKYFELHNPIVVPAIDNIPETTYTHMYIRKPDPYRAQVGDIDFYLEPEKYQAMKELLVKGNKIPGARIFPRPDLDMIELYNPDIDACGYISTHNMSEKVRIKLSEYTNL